MRLSGRSGHFSGNLGTLLPSVALVGTPRPSFELEQSDLLRTLVVGHERPKSSVGFEQNEPMTSSHDGGAKDGELDALSAFELFYPGCRVSLLLLVGDHVVALVE
jgi:hypothetical protein